MHKSQLNHDSKYLLILLILGMSGIFGRLGVVAFHHLYADKSLHYTTAFIYFGSAFTYDVLQTALTYKTIKKNSKSVGTTLKE